MDVFNWDVTELDGMETDETTMNRRRHEYATTQEEEDSIGTRYVQRLSILTSLE